jgi:hypothetical protein
VSDRKPQPGDRVRVVYEGEYRRDATDPEEWGGIVKATDGKGGLVGVIDGWAVVEVVEPADDPSADPIGTVRRGVAPMEVWIKVNHDRWAYAGTTSSTAQYGDEYIRQTDYRSDVIGAVPGTPAAEAQRQDVGYCGPCKVVHDEREPAVQLSPHGWEPRVFQSDGPEPPEDVTVLRWLDRDPAARWEYLVHTPSGWVWTSGPDQKPHAPATGAYWDTATRACPGRYEEVQP